MTISPILPVYSPVNINFSHGKGIYLYDVDGERYVDFHSGIAVSSLGHTNSRLISALKLQGENYGIYQIPIIYLLPITLQKN